MRMACVNAILRSTKGIACYTNIPQLHNFHPAARNAFAFAEAIKDLDTKQAESDVKVQPVYHYLCEAIDLLVRITIELH